MSFHCFAAGGTFFCLCHEVHDVGNQHSENFPPSEFVESIGSLKQDQLEEHEQDHMIVKKFRPLSPEAKKLILVGGRLCPGLRTSGQGF